MKAYEAKKGSIVVVIDDNVRVRHQTPVVKKGDTITIGRLDGMYCNGTNEDGESVCIAAWTQITYL